MNARLSSRGVALAAAMAVSAGAIMLLALRLRKLCPVPHRSSRLRSCISSGQKKSEKKKKKVQFAEEAMDSKNGNRNELKRGLVPSPSSSKSRKKRNERGNGVVSRGMPPNRVALYKGILSDRLFHRLASYSC